MKWKLKAKVFLGGENKPSKKIPGFLTITKSSIIYRKYFK
jgi:hypothetical protein